jgi:hypothetical protein
MWRIWTVVPRWKAVLSLVILNAILLWLYYHEDKKLDPDFVMYSGSGDTVGITPIMEEGTCAWTYLTREIPTSVQKKMQIGRC